MAAGRSYQDVIDAQNRLKNIKQESAVAGLPPGYKIGYRLYVNDYNQLVVKRGIMSWRGHRLSQTTEKIIDGSDFLNAGYILKGLTYYVYYNTSKKYLVDVVEATLDIENFGYRHPNLYSYRYLGKFDLTLDGIYENVVNENPIEGSDIQAGTIDSYRVETDFINTIIALVSASDPEDPVFGDFRLRITEDTLVIEEYNGSTWDTRLQLGGVEGDKFYPYLQARGLVPVGVDISSLGAGDLIPVGSKMFDFEGDLKDQNGVDPWDTFPGANSVFSTDEKFGTYSFTADADSKYLQDDDAYGIDFKNGFGIDFWWYVYSITDGAVDILELYKTIIQGSETTYESDTTYYNHICYLDSTHIAVAYRDHGDASKGKAKIGVITNDSTITFGAEYIWHNAAVTHLDICRVTDTSFAISFYDSSDGDKGKAIIGVVSNDDEIAYGAQYTFNAVATNRNAICRLDDTHIAIAYIDESGALDDGYAIVGVIANDDEITFGAAVEYEAGLLGSVHYVDICALSSTEIVVTFMHDFSVELGKAVYGKIVGDAITFKDLQTFNASDNGTTAVCSLDGTHIVVAYDDGNIGKAIVGSVNTTTGVISWGDPVTFNSTITAYISICAVDSTHVAISYQVYDGLNPDYGATILGQIAGDVITFDTLYNFNDAETTYIDITNIATTGTFAVAYTDTTDSNYGKAQIFSLTYNKITLSKNDATLTCTIDDGYNSDSVTFTMTTGWHHLSVNYDYDNTTVYFTYDAEDDSIDFSTFLFLTSTPYLKIFIPQNYLIDDLLLFADTYLNYLTESIAHYLRNEQWSSFIDTAASVILYGSTGGSAYIGGLGDVDIKPAQNVNIDAIAGDVTIDAGDDVIIQPEGDVVLSPTGQILVNGDELMQWQKVSDPTVGWFAEKTAGWTADRFTSATGGLEVDFDSLVPDNALAVMVSIEQDGTRSGVYTRRAGDTNISNTPIASNEYSTRLAASTHSPYRTIIWLSADYKAEFAVSNTSTDLHISYVDAILAPAGTVT